jgi:hypothetical protein
MGRRLQQMSKEEEIVGKPVSDAIGGEMAEEKEVPKRLSRKEFVKGAAVGGAGVAAASVLASCSPAAPAETVPPCPTCPPAEECAPCPTPAAGAEAGQSTLEVLDPSGSYEVTILHAPRLDTLEGKTICELSDEEWMSWRTFPLLRELLTEQYPTLTIIPYEEFPRDGDHGYPDFEAHPDLLKECDAVIVGNAG